MILYTFLIYIISVFLCIFFYKKDNDFIYNELVKQYDEILVYNVMFIIPYTPIINTIIVVESLRHELKVLYIKFRLFLVQLTFRFLLLKLKLRLWILQRKS